MNPSFTKILNEQGKMAVELRIFKNYEEGNLQEGNNKYTKALKVLYYVFDDEYAKFDWRRQNAKYGSPEWDEERKLRESPEFMDLLRKALYYKPSKQKYVITKNHHGVLVYGKLYTRTMKWKQDKEDATKFDFKEEAERAKSCFPSHNEFSVVEA